MNNMVYNRRFYQNRDNRTTPSAIKILSIVLKEFDVRSVVDFGCGVGTWLKALRSINNHECEIIGLDGAYVPKEFLVIDDKEFVPTDLGQRVSLDKRYDLAISLEVAEHLEESRGKSFVEDICNASDLVMFSAATKLQGGDSHKNEQRASYWVKLFASCGYSVIDCIRPEIWSDESIPVWYRQNILMFYKTDNEELNRLARDITAKKGGIIDIIHPELFESRSKTALQPIVRVMKSVYLAVSAVVKKLAQWNKSR